MSIVFESEAGEQITTPIFPSGSSIKAVRFTIGTTTVELHNSEQDGNRPSLQNVRNIGQDTGTTNNAVGPCFNVGVSVSQSVTIPPQKQQDEKEKERQEERDFIKEMNGWLMTVATLLLSMAFQAGLSIPGGYWSDTSNSTASSNQTDPGHTAGQPILRTTDKIHYNFLLGIDIGAFTCSMSVIILLLYKKTPEHRFLRIRSLLFYAMVLIAIVYAVGCSPKIEYIAITLPIVLILAFVIPICGWIKLIKCKF